MRPTPALAALLALLSSASLHAAGACCSAQPAAAAAETDSAAEAATETAAKPAAGHPLRGVIVAVLAEKSSLLVKHEEIPGVMRAMTMLLKVDADTLAAARKDQAITATLLKKPDGWWLQDVKPAAPVAAPQI